MVFKRGNRFFHGGTRYHFPAHPMPPSREKTSRITRRADFCLSRHLRRERSTVPTSNGKISPTVTGFGIRRLSACRETITAKGWRHRQPFVSPQTCLFVATGGRHPPVGRSTPVSFPEWVG